MTRRIKAAIIGSRNIGTDLLIKILRHGHDLEIVAMVSIDAASDGLARARRMGVATTDQGVEGLTSLPVFDDIDIVFDATSAAAHVRNDAFLRRYKPGIRMVDLTPAAIGPCCVPVVNGEDHLDALNVNMVTCGGQATIPMVAAVASVAPVYYAEIVASIASKSAGPGTRANIDEFTETTSRAIESGGGAGPGESDHRAEPRRAAADDARYRVHVQRPGRRSPHRRVGRPHGGGGSQVRAGLPPEAAVAV